MKVPDIRAEAWFHERRKLASADRYSSGKAKRLMDIIVSFTVLMVTLPLWPMIALAIKLNSRGPVFYTQMRVGKGKKIFALSKFRSMIERAEEEGALWANENDERVTAVGRILRRLHVDELPQLLHVLRGEMSLVGPRPERPEFVRELKREIPHYSLRHLVKPGLTGWAQVHYPYASSLEASREKQEYDLYYVSRMSLAMDLLILWKTAKKVFKKRQF
ncbi:MAG: sugar transferase [Clostridiales bacterium]|nr:sugar transferase [Clostridiales bacterium]